MSAGGASVHYQLLSPHTGGLYRNAISLSGSALNWWAHVANPAENCAKLAAHFGCQDAGDVADCLRKIPALDVLQAQNPLFYPHFPDSMAHEPMNSFSPRSDPESENPFLPEHPLVTMEKGNMRHVPYMLGKTVKL